MEKKVIFLDVDGTIVSRNGHVSKKSREMIQFLRKQGHYVFLCTGRNRIGVKEIMGIGFDGCICNSGAYIEVNKQILLNCFFKSNEIKKIINVLQKYRFLYNLEGTYITYQDETTNKKFLNRKVKKWEITDKSRLNYYFHICVLEKCQHLEPIQKITFMAPSYELILEMKKEVEGMADVVLHEIILDDMIHGEITLLGINKGTAVQKIINYLHFPIENTIGFGDSMNDLELIKTCFYGVAMENGSKKLREFADAICKSVDEDGVYYELKKIELI